MPAHHPAAGLSLRQRAVVRSVMALAVVGGLAMGLVVASALSGGTLAAAAAVAGASEPARLKIVTALVDETLKGLLPLTLNLPAPTGPAADGGVAPAVVPATLTELRYCGPAAAGAGRFRAVIRLAGIPAATEGGAAVSLIADGDCRPALGELGKRLSASLSKDDAALVLADLEATWHPWELRMAVARFVFAGEPRGAVGWGEGRREVLAFTTAGLVVPTELGPLVFHAAPAFSADGIEIAAVLGEAGASPPSSRPAAGSSAGFSLAADSGANALIELPYGLANHLLHTFTARPLPVRAGRETVDVQNASLRGAAGSVTVVALASSRSVPESARVTVTTGGEDLRVASVRADAQLESCSGLGVLASIGCNARNAARNAAAGALGATATDRYQNQLVRELAGVGELHFAIARRELVMASELVRIGPGARGLMVGAHLTPRATAPER